MVTVKDPEGLGSSRGNRRVQYRFLGLTVISVGMSRQKDGSIRLHGRHKREKARFGQSRIDGFKRYDPRVSEKWIGSKFLAAFAWGGGDWLWYDDITDSAAKDYITQIDEYWAAYKEK